MSTFGLTCNVNNAKAKSTITAQQLPECYWGVLFSLMFCIMKDLFGTSINILLTIAKFKNLGTTLTNQNYVHEEITSQVNSRNVCYHSDLNLLSF